MSRILLPITLLTLLAAPPVAPADVFDRYTNEVLIKVPGSAGVKRLAELTPALLAEHAGALPGVGGAFLVVKTNEGRFSKLVVQPARQRVSDKVTLPVLLIERFATYKQGEERTVQAAGQNVRLFDGFHFSLDLGQVVPGTVGGDVRLVTRDGSTIVQAAGKAEFYLLTKALPEPAPKKGARFVAGAKFEPHYFTGVYKLHDDGRKTATLHLKVEPNNEVSGFYYSGTDGRKYEVTGKVGNVPHSIQFKVTFPRASQLFAGMMFTGDGRVITGTSVLQGHETGFYAVRQEE
ncbi:MAG: hypothetical protein L0Z62_27275 [Gemmataceae bacterium]|nr:hypothetical protein [Gemmataceae bacterium]